MARSLVRSSLVVAISVTLAGGCERVPRAREREAKEAEAKARTRTREIAQRGPEPLPEEPPVELLRVPSSGLPCKVDDAFASKCRRCHTLPARHGAPFVFLTWQDTLQDRLGEPVRAVIGRAVRSGFMPYRVEANPPVQALTDDERKTILDWVDAGGPREECRPQARPGKSSVQGAPKASPLRLHSTPAPAAPKAR